MNADTLSTIGAVIAVAVGSLGGLAKLLTVLFGGKRNRAFVDDSAAEAARKMSTAAAGMVGALLGPAQERIAQLTAELIAEKTRSAALESELVRLRAGHEHVV